MKVYLRPSGAGEPIEVALHRTSVRDRECYDMVSGERHSNVEWEQTAPGVGWLRLRGRIIPVRISRDGSTLCVWIRGRVYRFEQVTRTPRRAKGDGATAQRASLAAPMPGTVLKINVKPGDRFVAHAALVVMESMKMELTLSAPYDGRVKEIPCRTGQLVAMGDVLLTFHEGEDEPVS